MVFFDRYVYGEIERREFPEGANWFATGDSPKGDRNIWVDVPVHGFACRGRSGESRVKGRHKEPEFT